MAEMILFLKNVIAVAEISNNFLKKVAANSVWLKFLKKGFSHGRACVLRYQVFSRIWARTSLPTDAFVHLVLLCSGILTGV
jgi:hypothetical protein